MITLTTEFLVGLLGFGALSPLATFGTRLAYRFFKHRIAANAVLDAQRRPDPHRVPEERYEAAVRAAADAGRNADPDRPPAE